MKEYFFEKCDFWKSQIIYKMRQKIEDIFKKHKDQNHEINSFGLYEIFKSRINIFKKNKIFKKSFLNYEKNIIKNENINYFEIKEQNKTKKWTIKSSLIFQSKFVDNDIKKILNSKWYDNINSLISNFNEIDYEKLFKTKECFSLEGDENKVPSTGELYYILLDNFLNKNKDTDYIFLDEPETGLNSNLISNEILPTLKQLKNDKRTLIISTHNNIFGVNTNPENYIFRESILSDNKNNNYLTYTGDVSNGLLKSCIEKDETEKNWMNVY